MREGRGSMARFGLVAILTESRDIKIKERIVKEPPYVKYNPYVL